jgi:ceramide glucosyltransferase
MLAIPALAAAAYYLLALSGAVLQACARRLRKATPQAWRPAALSILKPVHGRDPHLFDALRSHAEQDYPEFEMIFGVSDPADAAIEDIERLRADYPSIPISLHIVRTTARNAKAGVLAELAKRARYPILLVNDSDIKVPRGYLRDVTAPLENSKIGLVTCLYRASAESWPSRMEALGIATEFAPSVLVARLLGIAEFALGSTMVLRASTLAEIGGFEAIADYLADDYQLGRHISERGYRIHFAAPVVETALGAETWAQVWSHQVRWSRTIRVSRPSGYYGYAVTHATLWAAVAFASGAVWAGALALALRIAAGVCVGRAVLKDRNALRLCALIPFRDLFGFAVWIAGLFGDTVVWRGQVLRLRRDGRLIS